MPFGDSSHGESGRIVRPATRSRLASDCAHAHEAGAQLSLVAVAQLIDVVDEDSDRLLRRRHRSQIESPRSGHGVWASLERAREGTREKLQRWPWVPAPDADYNAN